MVRYDKYILNQLLDSYERSRLFTGRNKVNICISFAFSRKSIPKYFDESSLDYEEIHAAIQALEKKGYIKIVWKKGRHIVQKVLLKEDHLEEVYQYVKRTPKAEDAALTLQLLETLGGETASQTGRDFIDYLGRRIRDGKSVREYIALNDREKTERFIRAITLIEENCESCYIREFSIRHFADSKVFEGMLPLVGKVMRQFGRQYRDMDNYAILAEHLIYHTPDYVYIKGSSGVLYFGDSKILLKDLGQGFGICGEDLAGVSLGRTKEIKRVITIENLTTFFHWKEADSLLIYLGGYHNASRRNLLRLIYEQLPRAEYLHFGDIDAGGFEIYEDLRKRTGIPFQTYRMDLKTLKRYGKYAKALTANDRKRLKSALDKNPEYADVLSYMLTEGIKLEQECIELPICTFKE